MFRTYSPTEKALVGDGAETAYRSLASLPTLGLVAGVGAARSLAQPG